MEWCKSVIRFCGTTLIALVIKALEEYQTLGRPCQVEANTQRAYHLSSRICWRLYHRYQCRKCKERQWWLLCSLDILHPWCSYFLCIQALSRIRRCWWGAPCAQILGIVLPRRWSAQLRTRMFGNPTSMEVWAHTRGTSCERAGLVLQSLGSSWPQYCEWSVPGAE
jgi:hypothetical protein